MPVTSQAQGNAPKRREGAGSRVRRRRHTVFVWAALLAMEPVHAVQLARAI